MGRWVGAWVLIGFRQVLGCCVCVCVCVCGGCVFGVSLFEALGV
jgi:hypothetical protein